MHERIAFFIETRKSIQYASFYSASILHVLRAEQATTTQRNGSMDSQTDPSFPCPPRPCRLAATAAVGLQADGQEALGGGARAFRPELAFQQNDSYPQWQRSPNLAVRREVRNGSQTEDTPNGASTKGDGYRSPSTEENSLWAIDKLTERSASAVSHRVRENPT